jgi:hypothetical protein
MNLKHWVYDFIGLVAPWIVIISGAVSDVYNVWLYIGSITWFLMAVIMFLAFYE